MFPNIDDLAAGHAHEASVPLALSIEVIHDTDTFAQLAPEWRELLAASAVDGLFLTWEWLFTWWKHLAVGYELHIVLVRREGELVALAPLALRGGSFQQLPPVAALAFLGSGTVGSDYLDLIVRCGLEAEVVQALSAHLCLSGRTLALTRMRSDGPAAMLVERMQRGGWRVWRGPQEICPFASLRGKSFETYLASLGADHRYAFRRKLGRIERRFEARFELARTEVEREEALETLFRLHDLRWHSRGDAGAFSTPALRAFHHEMTRVALAAGWLRLWVLRLDGRPAAALYGFLYRRTFYFYQSGFDPAFAKHSVGLVMLGTAVRAAMEEGAEELDLLHGTERYKAHWTRSARELLRRELYAPGARGWMEHEATALTRKARRVAVVVLEAGRRIGTKPAAVEYA